MNDIFIVLIVIGVIHGYHVLRSERRGMAALHGMDLLYARLAEIHFALDERIRPRLDQISDELKTIDRRVEHFERRILPDDRYN
ncbi:MAG: hypothetical protein GY736_00145 [Sphingomonas sp.]|uniref:hypothetical protein n=1 Tax=Sphingomonas sp. TaxID=28214 RepID=UPI002589B548|nr:hypothetical protein [Sphingomonas sp.]MCP4024714.1 hypothetical protein [Sphingomonas sp.]